MRVWGLKRPQKTSNVSISWDRSKVNFEFDIYLIVFSGSIFNPHISNGSSVRVWGLKRPQKTCNVCIFWDHSKVNFEFDLCLIVFSGSIFNPHISKGSSYCVIIQCQLAFLVFTEFVSLFLFQGSNTPTHCGFNTLRAKPLVIYVQAALANVNICLQM